MTVPRSVRLVLVGAVAALGVGGLIQTATTKAGLTTPLVGLVCVVAVEVALGWFAPRLKGWAVGPLLVLPFAVWGVAAGQSGNIAWFVLVVALGQVAFTQPLEQGAAAWVVAIGLIATLAIANSTLAGWANWLAGISAGFWGTWVARHRIELIQRVNAAEAKAAAAASAVRRTQLAHDLHDVVAHTLAVTVLHLGGARLAVRDSPTEAEAAIEQAERLARRSMEELRSVVRVLSQSDDDSLASPQPGATDLPSLVEEYQRAGLHLECGLQGDLGAVSGPVGMVAFRVVQEALANATRHAPDQGATLDLAVDERGGVRVCVTNHWARPSRVAAGTGGQGAGFTNKPATTGAGPGMGLAAMRQRVDAVGGKLEAGPDGDGWVVRAVLPA